MNIAVLGGGAWGCTLAHLISQSAHSITIWEHNPDHAKKLAEVRHPFGIESLQLDQRVEISSDLNDVIKNNDIMFIVIPSQAISKLVDRIAKIIDEESLDASQRSFIIASKGIDIPTGEPLSHFFDKLLPQSPLGVLSGPCIAKEVAAGIPTSVVLATENESLAESMLQLFSSKTLRAYRQNDLLGVELGGALKNCIAIAAGIGDGLGFGENSKSALLTRGLAEMSRFISLFEANTQTIYGLAGLGDLTVTCFSQHSRNRTFGELLGKGLSPEEAKAKIGMTVEGEPTARAALKIASSKGIELPITHAVVQVCDGQWSPEEAVINLMTRDIKKEFE